MLLLLSRFNAQLLNRRTQLTLTRKHQQQMLLESIRDPPTSKQNESPPPLDLPQRSSPNPVDGNYPPTPKSQPSVITAGYSDQPLFSSFEAEPYLQEQWLSRS